jgi:hypothetical protein
MLGFGQQSTSRAACPMSTNLELDVRFGSRLCENHSSRRLGARLSQIDRSPHLRNRPDRESASLVACWQQRSAFSHSLDQKRKSSGDLRMSATGHERRPLRLMAAHRLPLCPVCNRSHATVKMLRRANSPCSKMCSACDSDDRRWRLASV